MKAIRPRIARFLFRVSHRIEIEGIEVGIIWEEAPEEQIIRSKMEAALALIRQYDPRRFRHLQRDVPRILVFGREDYQGRWHSEIELCQIIKAFALSTNTTPAILAATLVHEAMHARLFRWGIGYEEKIRQRVENICFKAAITFAQHLPETEEPSRGVIIQRNKRQIARDPAFWTDQGQLEAQLHTLHVLGAPRWMLPGLRWLAQRNRRKKRKYNA